MTLPSHKKFPRLPEGLVFELSYEGIDDEYLQPYYSVAVLIRQTDAVLVSENDVLESYILDVSKRLATQARLRDVEPVTMREVSALNGTFRSK